MRKRLFGIILLVLVAIFLVSCTGKTYEIAMITDTGDIDDGSFNQGTWEGIEEYAKKNDVSHKYYKPNGETTADYTSAIDLAIKNGAKIVITPGFYFEVPIFEVQDKYPDVKFVILDGSPHAGDYDVKVAKNTLSIFFKEEQAGFLAGYATVKDGFEKLGFMGGIAVPAVVRFGVGWVAGAYLAASELGNENFNFPANRYTYLGGFGPDDQYKTEAAGWYSSGTEVIHAAAGGAGFSVMAAAEDLTGKWVVGVDSDQADASPTVLTSAFKGVGAAAIQALEAFYANKFPGGEIWNLGAKEGAVDIPMTTGRFTTFNNAAHTAIFAKLVSGTIVVPTDAEELNTFLVALGYTMPEGLPAAIDPDN